MYKMASVTDHGSKGTFATYDGFFDFQKSVRWLRSRIRHESEHFKEDMEKEGHDTEFAWAPDSENLTTISKQSKSIIKLSKIPGTRACGQC